MRNANVPSLADIKKMLRKENSGKKIMPRFYDFMEGSDEYMSSLDHCKDDRVQRMIASIVQNVLKIDSKWMKFERAIFLEKRADNFFHGQFFATGHLVSFFYFDDIEIGCIAIAPKVGDTKGAMMYVRFDGATMKNRMN